MGKRSPILGYNHNVRYRGLVFHIQTEDSGLASPHLFTHLFHTGVIVSTRKLVYDSGSAEESIKSLMQAQHKATLKDLRRGHFDDKIDSYLGGTPGLLPRGSTEGVDIAPEPAAPEPVLTTGVVEEIAVGAPTELVMPMMELSEPVMITERPPTRPLIPPPPLPRSVTERALAQSIGRGTPQTVDSKPTVDTTLKTDVTMYSEGDATLATSRDTDDAPEIEIQLELDDHDEADARPAPPTRRATRDTELQAPYDQTRPTLEVPLDDHTRPTLGMVNEEARRASTISDGVPSARASSPALPPPPPPSASDTRKVGDRPSPINASALPPARPISRPANRPALSQPQVMSRPITSDERNRRESEAVEVYSPAPPSAELPGERPGQYAQHKKISTRIPVEGLKNERSGGVAIPAGLGRPHRPSSAAPVNRPGTAPPANVPSSGVPQPAGAADSSRVHLSEPVRPRAVTPPRVAPPAQSANPRAPTPSGGSSVVMSRPAVIVGAPRSGPTPSATVPRIRKAREDEGRGFGQGLISEKSLDEVILAYLSEDAEDK